MAYRTRLSEGIRSTATTPDGKKSAEEGKKKENITTHLNIKLFSSELCACELRSSEEIVKLVLLCDRLKIESTPIVAIV